jgi:alkaline phosphatase
MRVVKFLFFALLSLGLFLEAVAQRIVYSVQSAHSHNDYENKAPFFTAYVEGFGSIEADVFPVNGKLYVAHDKASINLERSLRSLYLEPLLQELSVDKSRHLILLVDIKENYTLSIPILIQELIPLESIIKRGQLQIVVSGNRPPPVEFSNYPDYIYFDDDQSRKSSAEQWGRVGLVSLRFSNFSSWKGEGKKIKEEMFRIKSTVDSVHKAGKRIRFWGAPDNPQAWKLLMKLKVDLIGTDKIGELAAFLVRD